MTIDVNLEVYCISKQCDLFLGQVSFAEEFRQDQLGSAPAKTCNKSWKAAGIRDKFNNTYSLLWCGPNSPMILKTWSNSIFLFPPVMIQLIFIGGHFKKLGDQDAIAFSATENPDLYLQSLSITKNILSTLTWWCAVLFIHWANVKIHRHLFPWSFVLPRK